MQYFIDHLAAFIIAGVVLLATFALSTRSNDSAIEATQVDLGKTQLRVLVDALEQDLNNIGAGMPSPNRTPSDRAIQQWAFTGGYNVLSFLGLEDDGAGTPEPVLVTYRWRTNGTLTRADGAVVPAIEIERVVGGTTSNLGRAVTFDVTLREDALAPFAMGSPADSLHRVRYIDVEIAMLSPVGPDGTIQETRWTKRFRPINLDAGRRRIIAARPGT
jgi:hypothetical protein